MDPNSNINYHRKILPVFRVLGIYNFVQTPSLTARWRNYIRLSCFLHRQCSDVMTCSHACFPKKLAFFCHTQLLKSHFEIAFQLICVCLFDLVFGHYVVLYVASSPGCSDVMTCSHVCFPKKLAFFCHTVGPCQYVRYLYKC